jgi:hypothetical protein
MAPHLVGYDVLVLQELFDDRLAEPLLLELAGAYPYRGEPVGRAGARGVPWRQDGGVVILSRWPIEREAQTDLRRRLQRTDCLADKGVAYAAVRKGDRATTCSGRTRSPVRLGVARRPRRSSSRCCAPSSTPRGSPPTSRRARRRLQRRRPHPELADMLTSLLRGVRRRPWARRHTWDPRGNAWADGRGEWLDYVLYAADHAAPLAAWNRAVPLRTATSTSRTTTRCGGGW